MENNELLSQILAAMQEQAETLTKMAKEEIAASETRINLKIENEIRRKISSLFGGYKLAHEKQWGSSARRQASAKPNQGSTGPCCHAGAQNRLT